MDEREIREHREWMVLRDEIWQCRENADVARRYFRKRAEHFRRLELGLTTAALLAQSCGIWAVFSSQPWAALLLTIVAGVLTVVSATQRYADRRAEHHLACKIANNTHGTWSALWLEIAATGPSMPASVALRRRIDDASARDRENFNSINEGVDEKQWGAAEREARAALNPADLVRDDGPIPPALAVATEESKN